MQDYIKYLKNVLGVSHILKDDSHNSVPLASRPLSIPQISVWVENYNQFSTEDHTLLNNMLAAMKIPSEEIAVRDFVDKDKASAISFDLVLNPIDKNTQTYSPQILHSNKNLKSAVWTFLQTIMQQYKNLN